MTINLLKEVKGKKLVFGLKSAVKLIKKGSAEAVYLADDCLPKHAQAIQTLGKKEKVEIKKSGLTIEQLQETLKKPFMISIISVVSKTKQKKETAEKKAEAKKEKKSKKETKEKKTKTKKETEKKLKQRKKRQGKNKDGEKEK